MNFSHKRSIRHTEEIHAIRDKKVGEGLIFTVDDTQSMLVKWVFMAFFSFEGKLQPFTQKI